MSFVAVAKVSLVNVCEPLPKRDQTNVMVKRWGPTPERKQQQHAVYRVVKALEIGGAGLAAGLEVHHGERWSRSNLV